MRQIVKVLMITIALLTLSSCDIGHVTESIELGRFPDNIVYYVNESDSIDLTGGTVHNILADGMTFEEPMSSYEIIDNVDFSIPGVYEVHIVFQLPYGGEEIILRIPVQVIERG